MNQGQYKHHQHIARKKAMREFNILTSIFAEKKRAEIKYGAFKSDNEMLGTLHMEHREVEEAMQRRDYEHAEKELIQLAAMAIKAIEFLRNEKTSV